jgi:hypothetical protein
MSEEEVEEAIEDDNASGAGEDNDVQEGPSEPEIPRAWGSTSDFPRADAVGGTAGLDNPFTVARRAVSDKVQLWAGEARDAVMDAVEKYKKLGLIGVAKEVGKWIKANHWTTTAIVLFLLSLIITPIALSAAGFTGAGIAAGEHSERLEKLTSY